MRALLVDDHPLFRAGLATLLEAWGMEVTGQANDGEEAIAKVRELRPDLVLMDLAMPRLNGLEATRAIKAEFPDVRVVVLTVSDDEQDLFDAIKAGAEGYLLKNIREEEFAEFVDRIDRGEPVMSAGLARKLLREFVQIKQERAPGSEAGLTDRERDVLELVATGAPNKEIAAALFISLNTVLYHMKHIMSKLHLANRAQAVAWALHHGITASPAS